MAVGELVALLEKSNHNGFPIVDKDTRRFLGLVKRKQIAALIECGVFSQHQNIRKETDLVAAAYGIQVSSSDADGSHASTPLSIGVSGTDLTGTTAELEQDHLDLGDVAAQPPRPSVLGGWAINLRPANQK